MSEQLSKRTAEADKRVGACVRAARVKAGLSQSRLATELGITFQQLQKYEKGKNRVSASRLVEAARALNVHVMALFDNIEGLVSDLPEPIVPILSKEAYALAQDFDAVTDPKLRTAILGAVSAISPSKAA